VYTFRNGNNNQGDGNNKSIHSVLEANLQISLRKTTENNTYRDERSVPGSTKYLIIKLQTALDQSGFRNQLCV
jgi:hypothetical protein